MQRKKSRFWLFIWSLIPGAGEMYLGFMKMGISLMLGFALLIMVAALTNIGVFALFPIVMYVYSFFHANNLGTLDDARFYGTKDQFLFGMGELDNLDKMRIGLAGKYRKAAAVVLIVLGAIMLWKAGFDILCDIFGWDNYYLKAISYFMSDDLPRIAIGIAVVWIGIGLIRGKKVDYIEGEQDTADRQSVSGVYGAENGKNASGMQGIPNEREENVRQTVPAEQNESGTQDHR